MLRRHFCTGMAIAAASSRLAPAFAQTEGTMKLVVPFPPGGATDLIARLLAERLTLSLGQPVRVENKAGAAGTIGSDYVARAPADGRTLLIGTLSTHGTSPVLPARTPYDPVNSFSHITLLAVSPLVFFAHPDVPASTLEEFLRYARANPGLPFASNGPGSYNHLACELLQSRTQTQMLHVPYKGAAEVMNAVATGQVKFGAGDLAGVTPLLQSGRVKALAVAAPTRLEGFANIPTVLESGVPDFNVDVWYALFGPARMPQAEVDRLHKAVARILQEPEFRQRMGDIGTIAKVETPIQLRERVGKENERWRAVVRNTDME